MTLTTKERYVGLQESESNDLSVGLNIEEDRSGSNIDRGDKHRPFQAKIRDTGEAKHAWASAFVCSNGSIGEACEFPIASLPAATNFSFSFPYYFFSTGV